jgi:hypothetical protein
MGEFLSELSVLLGRQMNDAWNTCFPHIFTTLHGGAAMANDFVTEASLREPELGNTAKFQAALAPTVSELKKYRISKRESQEKFWGRFGVTQSSGSRFETGLAIPAPVALLLKLYVNGKVNDGDLLG